MNEVRNMVDWDDLERTPPEGYRYVWEPEPRYLTTPGLIVGKTCTQPHCQRPAVAMFYRRVLRNASAYDRAWYCCDLRDHLYGRRIVDGVVMFPALKPVDLSSSQSISQGEMK